MPPQFLENIVILCFESRFFKQNSAIRLKSNIFPPKISGLATPLVGDLVKTRWHQAATDPSTVAWYKFQKHISFLEFNHSDVLIRACQDVGQKLF